LLPIQHKKTNQELIDLINKLNPDILCTGHYIWNHDFLLNQLREIKSKISPNIKILVGGPSIDAHVNDNFLVDNCFVDYAIYGPGENSFADIIESLVFNKRLIAFNTSNVHFRVDNKIQKASYKYVQQLKFSPFLYNKEMFEKMIEHERKNGFDIVVSYELTRGCPYECSFCDWNSGLSNKVTRRKDSYKDEIDLFYQLKIKGIYLADANVGQYSEDIDMISYLAEKNIKYNAGFKVDGNFSKLKKENNLKIYHILAQGNLIPEYQGFTFSVQDIDTTVLKNINRPDVGWVEHLRMIQELNQCYPDIQPKIQLIIGLPGQNSETLRHTLRTVCKEKVKLNVFLNELLPTSPAALDKNYQLNFNFKYSNSERISGNNFFRGKFPKSCFSFDSEQLVEMVLLSIIYSSLSTIRQESKILDLDIEKIVDYFLSSEYYKNLKNNLLTNWLLHDKFYFTINFDGSAKNVSSCQISDAAHIWNQNKGFLKFISRVFFNKALIKNRLVYEGEKSWIPTS
jgi:radical SAM superfamily enzyme YgiQ (UPF0313 family)